MTTDLLTTVINALALLFSFELELWQIILVSPRVSLFVILLSVPLAITLAFWLSNLKLESLIVLVTHTLATIPAVVIGGLLVYILLSRYGGIFEDLHWLFTQKAMIFGPILFSISCAGFKSINKSASETAITLGANNWQLALIMMFESRFTIFTAILSSGEIQKIAIARVRILKSEIWLLDEPTENLDQDSKQKICDLLLKLLQENKSIIIATHSKFIFAQITHNNLHLSYDN